MSKRILQIVTTLLAFVPIVTGMIGLSGTHDPLYSLANDTQNSVLLDSNLRFFAGVWLGAGLALLWTVPRINDATVLFRAIWGMIFVGGVGRLISMFAIGMPPIPFIGFTVLEIVGAPVFILWQLRITEKLEQPS